MFRYTLRKMSKALTSLKDLVTILQMKGFWSVSLVFLLFPIGGMISVTGGHWNKAGIGWLIGYQMALVANGPSGPDSYGLESERPVSQRKWSGF